MPGRSIANLHSVLDWDLSDFDRGTSHIEGTFGRVRAMAVNLSETINGAFEKMTTGITLPFIALSAFSVRSASDAAELQSAYDQVFGDLSGMMNRWAEETGNILGRSTQTMQESAQQFQSIFSKALDPAPAAELSKEFAVLTEDLGSFKNLSSEVARQKIFSGLSGESEPLKAVGVLMNEAAVKAKALELGLADVNGEVSEQNKVLARAAIIREQLAAADGDVIRTSDEFANMWRSLREEVSELTVEFGQRFLPMASRVVGWARSAVQAIKDLPEGVKDAIVRFGAFLAVLGPISLALSALALTLLPLFLARLSPVFLLISAVVNPIGTAAIALGRLAGGLRGVMGGVARLSGGGGLRMFAGLLLRFFTGPIGIAITAVLFFKDNIIAAFSKVAEIASSRLGGKFIGLFETLRAAISRVQTAFNDVSNSPVGDFFRKMIKLIGRLGEAITVFAGTVIVEFLALFLDMLTDAMEGLIKFIDIVDALLRGEWSKAWQIAKDGTGNAVSAMIGYVKSLFPFLRLAIELIERISGKNLGGDPQMPDFVKSFDYSRDDQKTRKIADKSAIGASSRPISSTDAKGRANDRSGPSGPSRAELSNRREEIRLMQALAVARESGNIEQERALQRQIDLRDKIDGYLRAGLSKQAAQSAAEKDMLELEQARAEANATILDAHERQFDLQLAEIRGDFEHLNNLKDVEFIERRILFYREQEIELLAATRRANEDLIALEAARADAINSRLADQEREHEIELARIRGDDPADIRQLEENLRRDDRIKELLEGGMNKADAESQAIREGLDRQRAHLQGTFRDTFRDGLRAAMDGNLGEFFQNWIKDRSFNALSNVLDRLADSLANLVFGGGQQQSSDGGLLQMLLGAIGGQSPGTRDSGSDAASLFASIASGLAGFNNGGSFEIKGFPGIDRNLLSLNGNPIARVSAGEIVNVKQGNASQASRSHNQNSGLIANFHFHGAVTNPQEVRRSGAQAAAQLSRAVSMGRRGI